MLLLVYIAAIICFVVAGVQDGLQSSWQDWTAFGLALFTLGHLLTGFAWPLAAPRR